MPLARRINAGISSAGADRYHSQPALFTSHDALRPLHLHHDRTTAQIRSPQLLQMLAQMRPRLGVHRPPDQSIAGAITLPAAATALSAKLPAYHARTLRDFGRSRSAFEVRPHQARRPVFPDAASAVILQARGRDRATASGRNTRSADFARCDLSRIRPEASATPASIGFGRKPAAGDGREASTAAPDQRTSAPDFNQGGSNLVSAR